MANIILKDKNGTDITHMGIDYLCMRTLEGGLVRFNEGDIRVISVDELPSENIKEDAIYKVETTEDESVKIVFYTYANGEWVEYGVGGGFVDVDEFPTENIDSEVIYRVVRQDEETGTTYTTYGIFDADDTKNVLEYNAEEGWTECGSAKDPVLAELVVTENGVYDEPMISNTPEPIIWDGVVGDKVTVSITGMPYTYVKVSDVVLSADDFDGATACAHGASPVVITADMLIVTSGGVVLPETMAISISDIAAFAEAMSVTFPETGMYFAVNTSGDLYMETITFAGTSTPADGWNKVTVNVTGSGGDNNVIDVESLPTENVDDSKIYRTTETTDPSVEIYVYIPDASDSPMTVPECLKLEGIPFDINIEYYTVDSVPLASEMLLPDYETYTFHVYVVLETGEDYMTEDGTTVMRFIDKMVGIPQENFVGTVHSIDEMTQEGYYFLVTEGSAYPVYGLPNSNAVKKFYEYNSSTSGWEECDSGERLMVDVGSLPTKNIDDTKVYRIKTEVKEQLEVVCVDESNSAMTVTEICNTLKNYGFTASVNYYVVDELPSSPVVSYQDNNNVILEFHIYILQDTGEPYVSTDGTTCVYLGESGIMGNGEYFGIINDIDRATAIGYYTLMCESGFKYSYGVSNIADNKRLFEYDGEWTDNSEKISILAAENDILKFKYDIADDYIENVGVANFLNHTSIAMRTDGVSINAIDDKTITEIIIPKGVTRIAREVFKDCSSLTSVTTPDMMTTIGASAFKNCTALMTVDIPDGVTVIDSSMFEGCTALTSVSIPDTVTKFGNRVFANCTSLTDIRIPDGILSIPFNCFYHCESLTEINIPDSVTEFGVNAFAGCKALTSIVIPDGITSITSTAFYGCEALTSITIPTNVLDIGQSAFTACTELTEVILPDGLISIGEHAFQNCYKLASVIIPNSVTTIGNGSFQSCRALTSIVIPNNITTLDSYAFQYCSGITSVTFPNNVLAMALFGTFWGCTSLTNITLPNGLTEIGNGAFNSCTSLTNIKIPSSVTKVAGDAFYDCTSMQYYDFTSHTFVPTLSSSATATFEGIPESCQIRVPDALYDEWIAAYNWSSLASHIVKASDVV